VKKKIIHPFLIALYPILFLFAFNINEVFPKVIIFPVLIALVLSLALFGFFRLITKDYQKAGLITTILFFCFYTFGKAQDVFSSYFLNNKILLFVFLMLAFAYVLWRFYGFILKEPSVNTSKRISIYIISFAGIFLLNILTSYFIIRGFSAVRLILLFSALISLFIVFYIIYVFVPKRLSALIPNLQAFLVIVLSTVLSYIVIYQCSFTGVTHRKLVFPFGSFLIFILVFIFYVKSIKVKRYSLIFIVVLQLVYVFVLIYKYVDIISYNLIPELAVSVFFVSIALKIIYSARTFKKVNSVLNAILIILVVMTLFSILKYEVIRYADNNKKIIPKDLFKNEAVLNKGFPPIYYIILDEYASIQTIKELFNYDNFPFKGALIQKGFYVNDWQTTSEHTHEVIASVLNIGYHKRNASARENFKAIQDNLVSDYLKKKNYKIIQYPPWRYERSFIIQNADSIIKVSKIGIRAKLEDFNSKILFSSLLRRYISQNLNFYRTAVNHIFSSVSDVHKKYEEQPFFVYAHILSPHAPFIFDKNGEDIGIQNNGNRYYLGQYIYMNNRVLALVNKLLQIHNGNCVIVVQSDHGPREGETGIKSSENQRHHIFNAIYLPDKNYSCIDEKVAININTFAIIFNSIFKENIALRPIEQESKN